MINFPGGQAVLVSIWKAKGRWFDSDGDIYFHFEFSACFPSLQDDGDLANEIKHAHSPLVIIVLDPRYE